MMTRLLTIMAFALLLSIFSVPALTSAQSGGVEETITLSYSPRYPAPGERVTVTAKSFWINLSTSNISWSLDGRAREGGIGKEQFSFPVGPPGSTSIVDVSLTDSGGQRASGRIAIRPNSVSLIWEAPTYTPPFYQGKALPSVATDVRVVAFPSVTDSSGRILSADKLVYTWKYNTRIIQSASGLGKQIFTYPTTPRENVITVEVSDNGGNTYAIGSTIIESVDPEIIVYQNHPLYGIRFEEALPNTISLESREISVAAYPYFFGTDSPSNSKLNYEWSLNGKRFSNNSAVPHLLTLRHEGGGGKAVLSVIVENISNFFQEAEKQLSFLLPKGENGQ